MGLDVIKWNFDQWAGGYISRSHPHSLIYSIGVSDAVELIDQNKNIVSPNKKYKVLFRKLMVFHSRLL